MKDSFYRLIRIPRVGCWLPAYELVPESNLMVVARFRDFNDIALIAKALNESSYEIDIFTPDRIEVLDWSNPPVAEFYEFLLSIEKHSDDNPSYENDVVAIWGDGIHLFTEETPILEDLDGVIR